MMRQVTITNTVHIPMALVEPEILAGNQDDPVPPDDYRPGDKHRVISVFPQSNPNLTFYVIGLATRPSARRQVSGPGLQSAERLELGGLQIQVGAAAFYFVPKEIVQVLSGMAGTGELCGK